MLGGFDYLFVLDGDGKLDGVEIDFAYSVIFESSEELESNYDSNNESDMWEE